MIESVPPGARSNSSTCPWMSVKIAVKVPSDPAEG
jgi:hypothetical protein